MPTEAQAGPAPAPADPHPPAEEAPHLAAAPLPLPPQEDCPGDARRRQGAVAHPAHARDLPRRPAVGQHHLPPLLAACHRGGYGDKVPEVSLPWSPGLPPVLRTPSGFCYRCSRHRRCAASLRPITWAAAAAAATAAGTAALAARPRAGLEGSWPLSFDCRASRGHRLPSFPPARLPPRRAGCAAFRLAVFRCWPSSTCSASGCCACCWCACCWCCSRCTRRGTVTVTSSCMTAAGWATLSPPQLSHAAALSSSPSLVGVGGRAGHILPATGAEASALGVVGSCK